MIHRLKDLQNEVYLLLKSQPATRDNDRLLMVKIWCRQNHLLRPDPRSGRPSINFESFAREFIDGVYASPESIRRCRQRLQETKPELRGTKYGEKKKAAKEVQKEIKYL